MTKYMSRLSNLPAYDTDGNFETFREQGEMFRVRGTGNGELWFEADDLWDAHELVSDVVREVNANMDAHIKFEKAVEYDG